MSSLNAEIPVQLLSPLIWWCYQEGEEAIRGRKVYFQKSDFGAHIRVILSKIVIDEY